MTNTTKKYNDSSLIIKKSTRSKVKPNEFMGIMQRLELIDQQIKQEEELFDTKIKSLELEKQYLWNMIQPK
jgi:hypothetical protein